MHPLAARSQYAFEILADLDPTRVSQSPLLQSLVAFKEHKLAPLLSKVMQDLPEFGGEEKLLHSLALQPKRLEPLLARIVEKIDAELPGFFRAEKETGVWEWLRKGGSSALDYSVGGELPFSESLVEQGRRLITDFAGEQVVFDLSSRTTHVGNGVTPTPHTVLSSLCAAGTLGEEVVDLNRARTPAYDSRRARRALVEHGHPGHQDT